MLIKVRCNLSYWVPTLVKDNMTHTIQPLYMTLISNKFTMLLAKQIHFYLLLIKYLQIHRPKQTSKALERVNISLTLKQNKKNWALSLNSKQILLWILLGIYSLHFIFHCTYSLHMISICLFVSCLPIKMLAEAKYVCSSQCLEHNLAHSKYSMNLLRWMDRYSRAEYLWQGWGHPAFKIIWFGPTKQ